jgi:hypothetical protein
LYSRTSKFTLPLPEELKARHSILKIWFEPLPLMEVKMPLPVALVSRLSQNPYMA